LKEKKTAGKVPAQKNPPPDHSRTDKKKPSTMDYIRKLMPLIKSFALWFLLVIIVHLPGIREDFRNMFVGFTTGATEVMGKLFFLPVERIGFSTLTVGGFSLEIIVECTAYNFYLFAIALTVFANWRPFHKFINLLIFFGTIFMVNNIRFIAMGYIGRNYPDLFNTTHDYVWNILFGFMIFGLWAWRDKVCNPDFQPKAAEGEQP
jgi:exosortase/archaeosortase family protein